MSSALSPIRPFVHPSGNIATLECPRWTPQKVHSGRSGLYDWLKTRGTGVYCSLSLLRARNRSLDQTMGRKCASPPAPRHFSLLIGCSRVKTCILDNVRGRISCERVANAKYALSTLQLTQRRTLCSCEGNGTRNQAGVGRDIRILYSRSS